MIVLEDRSYQDQVIAQARQHIRDGARSVLIVAPTGSGKTVIAAKMIRKALELDCQSWFLAHREELIDQTSDTFGDFAIEHGIIKGKRPLLNHSVFLGMVQTTANRLDRLPVPRNVFFDECHHLPATTWTSIYKAMPRSTRIIGLTATPERQDGKGLGPFFDVKVEAPSIAELTDMNFLVPADVYVPPNAVTDTSQLRSNAGDYIRSDDARLMNQGKITGDVIQHYQEIAPGTAAVVFCCDIAHACSVAEEFNNQGIRAAAVYGSPMNKDERKRIISAFRDGIIQVLTSADLISEGFDLPRIETAILLRHTKSLALYLQQVGRTLRPDRARGKKRAIILDHVGNALLHGLPDARRQWSLEGRKAREEDEGDQAIDLQTCERCYRLYSGNRCKLCPKEDAWSGGGSAKEIEVVDGELVKVGGKQQFLEGDKYSVLKTATTHDELVNVCRENAIDYGLASRILKERAKSLSDLRRVSGLLNYSIGWVKAIYVSRHGEDGYNAAVRAEGIVQTKLPIFGDSDGQRENNQGKLQADSEPAA